MKPLPKRILILLVAACLLLAAALAAATAYLNSGAFRRVLTARIDDAIAGRIDLGHHRLAPFSGRLILGDIRLADADGTQVVSIERVELQLFWPALARRTLHISRLLIHTPQVALQYDADDQLNLLKAIAVDREPPPGAAEQRAVPAFQVELKAFELRHGRITLVRPAMGWHGAVERIDISGGGRLAPPFVHLEVTLDQLRWQGPDGAHALASTSLRLDYDHQAPDPLALTVNTSQSQITLKGAVNGIDAALDLDLVCDLDIDLAEVQAALPQLPDVAGRINGRITAAGALKDPAVTVGLAWVDARAGGVDLDRLTLDLGLAQRQVTLHGMELRAPWGELDLSGGADLRPIFPHSFARQVAPMDTLAYHADLVARGITPGRVGLIDFPWGGTWKGRIQTTGRGLPGPKGTGDLQVHLAADGVTLADDGIPTAAELGADARWADGLATLARSEITLGEHRAAATGRIDIDRLVLDAVEGHIHLPRLDHLGALVGIDLPAGRVGVEFSGRGPVQRPSLHAVLLARELAREELTIGHVLVEASLDADGTVHLTRLVLENQGSYLEGRGRLDLLDAQGGLRSDLPLEVTLDLDPLEVSHFIPAGDFNARLLGQLQVKGSATDPVADLALADSDLQWQTLAAQLQGAVRWQAGVLEVPELLLSTQQSTLRLQGNIQVLDAGTGQWTGDPQLQLRLSGQPIDLADVADGYGGILALAAEVEGPLSQLQGSFRVEGHDLDLGVQAVESIHLEGRLTPGKIHVEPLTITLAPGQQVRGRGWYGFDQQFEVALTMEGLELRHIDVLGEAPQVSGFLDLDLKAGGTLTDPRATGRLKIREPRLADRQWHDFSVAMELMGRHLAVEADLSFQLSAGAWLDKGDFEVTALFEQTDLGPYLALLVDDRWTGRLSGRVRAAGNWHALIGVEAHLALADAVLRYEDIELVRLDTLDARLTDGVLHLPETRLALMQEGDLRVAASGAVDRELSIQVDGRLPLAVLDPFSDQIAEAAGALRITARASGPPAELTWHADVDLDRMGFYLPDLDQSVHDLNGRVVIAPKQVTMRNLSGMLDSGRFILDGEVGLTDLRPTHGALSVTLQALPLQIPGTLDTRIGGDLMLTGDSQRARLAGQIVLLEGAYFKDLRLNLLSAVTQTQRAEPVTVSEPPPSWLDAIDLDVSVTHRYPFLVDNNVARLEVIPDLRLTGTAARPVLDGRARVTEGEVYFRRRSFTVTRGVVDFINPYRIEPTLDIAAETQIRQYRIALAATGTPDNLAISLQSDPPESDSNILSLILLGRTADALTGTDGGATTGQMLASLIESAWGEDIRRGVGVDILEVETGSPDDGENNDRIQVTVGKRLSPRLTIKYAVETGSGETIQRAISEYRLLEHVLASGFQDTAGVYGGELMFRFEFR